jgi:hypothetical protein
MPTLTRWFLRAALVYLVSALAVGALLQWPDLAPRLAGLWPTYLHLLVVGWITQVIFGVAFWMFPRFSPEQPYGNIRLGWASFLLLNTGLLLRAIGEPLRWLRPAAPSNGIVAASALLQLLAGWAFVLNTWPRVKRR